MIMPMEMHLPMQLGEFKQQVRKGTGKENQNKTGVTNIGERGEENPTEDGKKWKLGQLSISGPEPLRACRGLCWPCIQPACLRLRLCSFPGCGRGSHCTTCSTSPQCPLQEMLPRQSCTSELCETPQSSWTEASTPSPGINALLQLPKPHTNPQGLAAETPGPSQKPPLCTQGTCAGGADVLSPSSGLSLMDLGVLKLSELLTSASASRKRTPALPFSLGLYSGAPAPPAQRCSDHSFGVDAPPKMLAPFPCLLWESTHSPCPQLKLLLGTAEVRLLLTGSFSSIHPRPKTSQGAAGY